MSARTLRLGISPCPNDTFAFHGLLTGAVRPRGFDLRIEFDDVQTLNARLARGELDASKASFFAALRLAADTRVLRAGSALGFGVGPLLLSRVGAPPLAHASVLVPGEATTAHLLFRAFHPGEGNVEHVIFRDVIPRLERGEADYGVCIHEGRFTYERHGLTKVEDLGATWERATGSPLPLGGILARRGVSLEDARAIDDAIRASLVHARSDPRGALRTMRTHAAELDDDVIRAHVDLYVNERTIDLGDEGVRALRTFEALARRASLVEPTVPPLSILDA